MADPVHLKIIKQGVAEWNAGRHENRDMRPDLRGAHLIDATNQLVSLFEKKIKSKIAEVWGE
jgi:hypothetical protein